MTIYRNTLKAISDPDHSARVIFVPFFSRFGPILMIFWPLMSQCCPIVLGHLDPLTIPLSFFRESKALLASTVIFVEDTSCYL